MLTIASIYLGYIIGYTSSEKKNNYYLFGGQVVISLTKAGLIGYKIVYHTLDTLSKEDLKLWLFILSSIVFILIFAVIMLVNELINQLCYFLASKHNIVANIFSFIINIASLVGIIILSYV